MTALAAPGAMALAGGTSLVMLLKHGLIDPEKLVYLGGLTSLAGIAKGPAGELRIGALTTIRDVASSAFIKAAAPALASAAGSVGNPRVRSVATVGGALAHADPRQDLPPVLLALGASVTLEGPGGQRRVPLSEFFRGFMETVIGEDELLTEVVVPPGHDRRSAYARFTPASEDDYPTVGVAVSLVFDRDGAIRDTKLALAGVAEVPLLVAEAAQLLRGQYPSEDLLSSVAEAAEAAVRPTEDGRGSPAYKKAMAAVWTYRVLRACLGETTNDAQI